MHHSVKTVRTLLLTLLVILASCGADSAGDPRALEASADVTSDIAMSIPALDEMSLEEGSSVIVPLDRTVLALDADSLAAFASEGSLEQLLAQLVIPYVVEEGDLVDGASLSTAGGRTFDVAVIDEKVTVGAGTLVELRERHGVVLIVVDDLLES